MQIGTVPISADNGIFLTRAHSFRNGTFEIGKNLQFQLHLWITTPFVNPVLLIVGVSPQFSDKRWLHATRKFVAMVYALGSVALLLLAGRWRESQGRSLEVVPPGWALVRWRGLALSDQGASRV